jgi:hypothetical protein
MRNIVNLTPFENSKPQYKYLIMIEKFTLFDSKRKIVVLPQERLKQLVVFSFAGIFVNFGAECKSLISLQKLVQVASNPLTMLQKKLAMT